jgi:hypothetical protein
MIGALIGALIAAAALEPLKHGSSSFRTGAFHDGCAGKPHARLPARRSGEVSVDVFDG